jgi:methyl-accepting chemotaxis protein
VTGGFGVSAEELSDKSKEIGEVSSSIRECVAASDEMGVGGLVYGVLFDPTMLPVLSEAKDSLADMIGDLADAADQISTNLKKNADTYSSVETFLLDHFTGLQSQTGGGGGGR